MKKLAGLLFALTLVLSLMAGCRRQTNGTPGDPTVNNTTTGTVAPTHTTRATRPATEPTRHTTLPETTNTTNDGTAGTDMMPGESSDIAGRNRMIPSR